MCCRSGTSLHSCCDSATTMAYAQTHPQKTPPLSPPDQPHERCRQSTSCPDAGTARTHQNSLDGQLTLGMGQLHKLDSRSHPCDLGTRTTVSGVSYAMWSIIHNIGTFVWWAVEITQTARIMWFVSFFCTFSNHPDITPLKPSYAMWRSLKPPPLAIQGVVQDTYQGDLPDKSPAPNSSIKSISNNRYRVFVFNIYRQSPVRSPQPHKAPPPESPP
jgi:hypothetical protein